MRKVSEELGRFQVDLSSGRPAKVTPKIASDVFASIKYLEDTDNTALARRCSANRNTMAKYTDPQLQVTPNLNKAVHMLKALGYDVYLEKIPDGRI